MSVNNDPDDKYKSEFERRKTFLNSTHFPNPNEFARVGFYCLQEGDCVQCVFCGVVITNWCKDDWPLWRHVEANPSCPFLKGEEVGNEPIRDICGSFYANICPFCNVKITVHAHSTDCVFQKHMDERGFMIQKPIHLHMCEEHNRNASFDSAKHLIWNYDSYEMAEAGFFFTKNLAKCFWCDGTLGNDWNLSENLMQAHANYYPQCTFAQYYKMGSKHMKECLPFLPLTVKEIEDEIQKEKENYNKIQLEKPEVEYKNMEQESERLKTFDRHWLFMRQKKLLAEAGFFYVSYFRGLECAFCGIKVKDWAGHFQGDSPYELHVKKCQQCPFMKGEDVGNVPIPKNDPNEYCPICGAINFNHYESCTFQKQLSMEDNTILTPIHPQMSKSKDRLHTFSECNSTVHELVKFGFFSTGSIVKCFWCDKILKRFVRWGHETNCPYGLLHQFCKRLSECYPFRAYFKDYLMYNSIYYEPPIIKKERPVTEEINESIMVRGLKRTHPDE